MKEGSQKSNLRCKEQCDDGWYLNNEDTWKLIGISKMTFYKYKKEIMEEMIEEAAQ